MAGRSIGKAPDIAYIGGNLRKGLAMNIAATVIPDRDDAVAALAARDQLTRAQEAVSELQHLLTSAEDSNKVTQRALDDALFVIQTCFT